ncbi:uncharacterized protein METZ01_LOCUS128824, partial [marine metagenome]
FFRSCSGFPGHDRKLSPGSVAEWVPALYIQRNL